MYWNYIDMLFGNFTSPKVRFTIKGIVIPEATRHNPCLNNLSPSSPTLSSSSLSGLEEQILNNKIFSLNSHEIVIVMTPRSIDTSTEEYNSLITKTAVINNHNICKNNINNHNPIVIVSGNIDNQAGHSILLSQFIYL
ncbi:uncharacterized protein LOC103575863 [Microplitis demolitor]|uniref:uncharacterized protein LOC103575863 n=1 Tax=Microplitis demolitor TaxID=69319 RepID=UPI0004CCD08D|nr:uncharacterized protein LOC103575863 [Microplitis demolitor]